MCSIVDGAFPVEEEKTQVTNLDDKVCQKCKTERPVLTLRKKDVYCKACFLTNCNHKFRSTLGKNKAIKPKDRILVAFSGSQGSLAVLKLIRNSLEDENNPKKVNYTPHILIIDDGLIDFSTIVELAQKFNFPIYAVHLSEIMNLAQDPNKNIAVKIDDYEKPKHSNDLSAFLNQSSDQTSKTMAIKDLRRQILIKSAIELNSLKIFTGECATSLAITLLSGVASGRGAQVGNEAAFSDQRHSQVQILRPLREFSVKEVAFFNQHNPGEEVPIPHENEGTKQDAKSFSIEKLTESFVLGLQEGFPSTVPTIFRTGDKLLLDISSEELQCVLCHGLIDKGTQKRGCSALEATQFSRLVSEKGPEGLPQDQLAAEMFEGLSLANQNEGCNGDADQSECSGNGLCSEGSTGGCSSKQEHIDLAQVLCYSCSNSTKDPESLPTFIKNAAKKSIRQKQMKDEIQDFLL